MRLSVCCATRDPGPQVAAILAQLRPLADEIFLAVDARLDSGMLGRYADCADVLVRYEASDSLTESLAWLHAQCSGDWILRIDGDEVISPRLLARLPQLLAASEVFQYRLPCWWLYPNQEHCLAEPPWCFDSVRLVRNDPATLWFAGLSHSTAEPVFPAGYLPEGFYHLSHLLLSESARARKVEHYLSIASLHSPQVIARDVPPMYLPERARHGPLRQVPHEDLPAIAAVLAAGGPESPTPSPVPLIKRGEIERHWQHRRLGDGAYRARLEPLFRDRTMAPEEARSVPVLVRNYGDETWPGGPTRLPRIRLGHRWSARAAGPLAADFSRTELPCAVPPGAEIVVPAQIWAPAQPGRYGLHFDLVHEGVRWFERPSPELWIDVA